VSYIINLFSLNYYDDNNNDNINDSNKYDIINDSNKYAVDITERIGSEVTLLFLNNESILLMNTQ